MPIEESILVRTNPLRRPRVRMFLRESTAEVAASATAALAFDFTSHLAGAESTAANLAALIHAEDTMRLARGAGCD